jgi:hypothetical protein
MHVRLSTTSLADAHQRLMQRLLARGAEAPERRDGEPFDAADHPPAAIALARENWRRRMVHERQSAAVFSQLVERFLAADLPLDFGTWALRCSMDELRHALLCAQVVEHLGGEPHADVHGDALRPAPLPTYPVEPIEDALRHALFTAMSETVSVALLSAERELITEPFIARVAKQLAADEVGHARLGWTLLAHLRPQLEADDAMRARTQRWVAVALPDLRSKMLEAMPLPSGAMNVDREQTLEAATALGFSRSDAARELLEGVFGEVLGPALAPFGLDQGV